MCRIRLPALLLLWCLAPPATAQGPKLNIVHPLPPAPAWLEGYQVRWPVRVLGEPAAQTAQTVLVTLPTGGWLRPDASDLAVQTATGELTPAAVLSHEPAGQTILQFKRHGNDPWYWIYGVSATGKSGPRVDPKMDPAFHEGLTLELRDWAGTDLASWARVREGLAKSDRVIGNAVVGEVLQNCNPARPDQPANFAASYRGFLNVTKEGTYRFLVNADDAAFVFIDGFKVVERPGAGNRPLTGKFKASELEKLSNKVNLTKGIHTLEVHQVVGNSTQAQGICALLWTTPDQPKFSYVPPTAIAQPLHARVAAVERPNQSAAPVFTHGLDDALESNGLKLYLTRFEAQGPPGADETLQWDFGDGTTGKGRSVIHVYFKEGDYPVALASGSGLPPFRRTVHVWPEPVETSPLSLGTAIKALGAMEWQKFDTARLRQVFSFLQVCQQPDAWPLVDAVAQHLLRQKDLDLETRSQLYVARLEALTHAGQAADALKLAEQVAPEFSKTPALQVRLLLGVAAIYQYHFRDPAAASKIYKTILDTHGRTEHPNLRLAAVRWGDLFAETGDLVRASETYRIAATLGGEKLAGGTVTEASTRGALLRIAEQKLRGGEIGQTRQLLERLDLEHPGRRLDGLYCFLRAETGRFSGRYEEALRYYEMIFKLPQWAGYRDRATFGIADTYARMGELEKAQKWLGDLKEGFPKYYESQKGEELRKRVDQRLESANAASTGPGPFKRFETGFEPEETEWFGAFNDAAVVHALGLRGPHVALMDAYPRDFANFEFNRPLQNLSPGGTYWVEIWYHDEFLPLTPPGHDAHVTVYLFGETKEKPQTVAQRMLYRNTHHQWHKLGFQLKAPPVPNCLLKVTFMNMSGALGFDALSVRPVSDRQLDALASFQEGSKGP